MIPLYFPESSLVHKIEYVIESETLNIIFRNADRYSYSGVPSELIFAWTKARSAGSFFHEKIKPVYEGRKYREGTLGERVEIWLQSKDAKEFAGSAVALEMGNPVNVCAFMEADAVEVLRQLYTGDDVRVVVVPET